MKRRQFLSAVVARVLLLIGLVIASGLWGSNSSFAYDEAKFCAPEGEQVIVFVDVTTPFDERSKALFEEGILSILAKLSGGQRISIFTIEDTFASSKLLFGGCVPFCPSEVFWDWIMSDCTSGLVRLKTNEQRRKLGSALRARLSSASELPYSEIIRTLASDLKSAMRGSTKASLFIFSDMIENSEFVPGKVFHSATIPDLLKIVLENNLLPKLDNVPVNVFGVGRGGDPSRKALPQPMLNHIVEFWEAYFKRAGASNVYIGESLSVN